MSNITLAVESINDRHDVFDNAGTYYNGAEQEVFAHARFRRLFKSTGLDYVLNYTKTVVDTVLDRLEIASVAGTDDASNAAINKIWEQNELTLDAKEIHKNALVFGECYAIVWPDEEGEVQITYNSPLTTVIIYDDENPRTKSYAAKMWQTKRGDDKIVRLNLYYSDRIEKYSTRGDIDLVPATAQWAHIETVENPFGKIPVFHFRTHKPHGTPEHAAAIGPQDAINKLVANHLYTVDYQGAPQRYALTSGDNTGPDDFDDDDTARENISGLKNSPGDLWYLQGVDSVGQFPVADPKHFTDPIMAYVKAMASLTQTPLHYFQNNGQFASGEALRTAEAPLIKKVEDRQKSFGATWREIFKFALEIMGVTSDVQVDWKAASTVDPKEVWEIAQLKKAAGLPLDQILFEAGYDREVVADLLENIEETPAVENPQADAEAFNAHNVIAAQNAKNDA